MDTLRNQKGVPLGEFLQPEATINTASYYETLKRRAIENKRIEILILGDVLTHDNVRFRSAGFQKKRCVDEFQWDIFHYPE